MPRRKLSKSEIKLSTKPWIAKPILPKIRYRDKLYSKIIRGKHSNPNWIYLHKKFRNSVVKDVKASKSDYFKNYFLCEKIWSGIRSIININKSIGPYSIPAPLLRILKTHISPLISSLINDSFLCGIFPSKLILAKVTPVFKKGSRQDKDNYRPISVLFIFSKIFEKAMISAFMAILNLVTFFIHFNLALGKSARQIMH